MNKLEKIGEVFRTEETDYLELSKAINDYRNLVLECTNFEFEDESNRKDIHFKNGKALGATWAALCLNDIVRTKLFIKGLFSAIEKVKKARKGAVNVLYAGTGPFATLILPIMASYSKHEVQFILMEINKESLDNAESVIDQLGFMDYIKETINEDATRYVFNADQQIDIVVSETMQIALEREQQVPIMINIMKQMRKGVIMIPENITIDLCMVNVGKLCNIEVNTKEEEYCQRLDHVFVLNSSKIKEYSLMSQSNDSVLHFPKKSIEIPKRQMSDFPQLALLTEIQVFGEDRITINESSLTLPLLLNDLSRKQKESNTLNIGYKVDHNPGFECEWV